MLASTSFVRISQPLTDLIFQTLCRQPLACKERRSAMTDGLSTLMAPRNLDSADMPRSMQMHSDFQMHGP
jgi:hypothetical protein